MRNITQTQKDSIILDAAVLFFNYGLTNQRELGITKGGVNFTVTENVRQIEYDGRRGPTMGMEVVDEITAAMVVTTLEATQENLELTLNAASMASGLIQNTQAGLVPDEKYLANITAFGKQVGTNQYKKITLFNVAAAGGLNLNTQDKAEAGVQLTLNAHWNPEDVSAPVYTIEDDTTGPQAPPTGGDE
jgi:hypothetical protein